jgi:TetR/AcrR family tetracycline transcriptional repressor
VQLYTVQLNCTAYNWGMSSGSKSQRRAGQRAGLSRQGVLDAARWIADQDGLDRLSMRRLARELGVMPNALYSYFPDKEALLDDLLDELLGEIEFPDPDATDWRDGLVNVMDSSRRLLLAHPQLVAVFLSRPTLGPNAARLGEITLQLLGRSGIHGELAVEALRVLVIYSLGFAAYQAPRQQDDPGARTKRGEAAFADLPEDRFPEMRRLASHVASHPTDQGFYSGLNWLLDGIASDDQRRSPKIKAE